MKTLGLAGIVIGVLLILSSMIELDPTPEDRLLPTEVIEIENGVVVKINGTEEEGVFCLNLPSQTSAQITHLGGLILSTPQKVKKPGMARIPIWGTAYHPQFGPQGYRYGYLEDKAGAVLVILGKISSGREKVFGFKEGECSLIVENSTSQSLPLYLYYHDILGYHQDNGWDGERSYFKIEILK